MRGRERADERGRSGPGPMAAGPMGGGPVGAGESGLTPGGLAGLQRQVGNAAVGRLLAARGDGGGDVVVQRDASVDPAAAAQRSFVDTALRGSAEPLEPKVRADMESATGRDLSAVRIHRDAAADRAARSVSAEAFTSGRDIVFRRGRYNPSSRAGRKMIAHELEHVEQQGRGSVPGTDLGNGMQVSHPRDDHERAADRAADRIVAQRSVDQRSVDPGRPGTVSRGEAAPGSVPRGEASPGTDAGQHAGGSCGQHGDGQAGVVPAQRIAIQRNVGFEFEVSAAQTMAFRTPVTEQDRTHRPLARSRGQWEEESRPGGGPADKMRGLRKKEQLLAGTGFTAEADESSTGGSDLEFVTRAVAETPAGRGELLAIMNNISAIASRLNAAGLHTVSDLNGVGGASVVPITGPAGIGVVNTTQTPLEASPQATAGIRLDRLDELMRYIATPEPVDEDSSADEAPEGAAPSHKAQAHEDLSKMDQGRALTQATQDVERALGTFSSARSDLPSDFGSQELRGFLSLIVAYLNEGATERKDYAKLIAPILSRSHLSLLFNALPEPERQYLGKDDAEPFRDLVLNHARTGPGGQPVLAQGLTLKARNPDILSSVTREKWLRGMTQNVDLMSAEDFGTSLGPEEENLERAGAEQLESMGALYRMEEVGLAEARVLAPILELRRMRQGVQIAEWPVIALATFDLIMALNTGGELRYQRPDLPPPPPPPPPPGGGGGGAPPPPPPGGGGPPPPPGPGPSGGGKPRKRDRFKGALSKFGIGNKNTS